MVLQRRLRLRCEGREIWIESGLCMAMEQRERLIM
jgi:hypothetical protein